MLLFDKYKFPHELTREISSGGQGSVWRTTDPDVAVKLTNNDSSGVIRRLQVLPIPSRPKIGICLPIAGLDNGAGYSMLLLDGMMSFEDAFSVMGSGGIDDSEIPQIMNSWGNDELAKRFVLYSKTGGLRRRLLAISKCAAELARLNANGLIYCDVNLNNLFISPETDNPVVWLIDADNICMDGANHEEAMITHGFAAPELERGESPNTSEADCWAFAVAAFKVIFMWQHPFEGALPGEADFYDEGLAKAYSGEFPYIFDPDDTSNSSDSCFPPECFLTPELERLFTHTFCNGRLDPSSRPVMFLWPQELARASDKVIVCPVCGCHYYFNDKCMWCESNRPSVIKARSYTRTKDGRESTHWEFVREISPDKPVTLHKRLFAPFKMTDFTAETLSLTLSENTLSITRHDPSEEMSISNDGINFVSLGRTFVDNIPDNGFTIRTGRNLFTDISFS